MEPTSPTEPDDKKPFSDEHGREEVERIKREARETAGQWHDADYRAGNKAQGFNGDRGALDAQIHKDRGIRFSYGEDKAPALTTTGDGERLVKRWGPGLRYVPEWGWLIWDGRRFKRDRLSRVVTYAKETVRECRKASGEIADELGLSRDKGAQAVEEHFLRSENRIDRIVESASTEPGVIMSHHEFDNDPDVINTQNGVIELRGTGDWPHSPDFHCRRLAEAAYQHDAEAPAWQQFLRDFTCGDDELIDYLQRAVGYSITGHQTEQCMFFLYGPTAGNGKSTFIDAIAYALGDYWKPAPPAAFLDTGIKDGPQPEIVSLAGARFISAAELEAKDQLSVRSIKTWTGEGTISARGLWKDPIEFHPTGKIWFVTNDMPRALGDEGINRRIKVIPCRAKFVGADEPDAPGAKPKDPDMLKKLKEEATGILAWAIEGARRWYEDGLRAPPGVRDAVDKYKSDTDPTYDFVRDYCVHDESAFTPIGTLWDAFEEYKRLTGVVSKLGKRSFGNLLERKGFPRHRDEKQRGHAYIKLTPEGEEMAVAEMQRREAAREDGQSRLTG